MKHEVVPGSHRARLDALEESQRKHDQRIEELTTSMAGMAATIHHGFERLERMMVEQDGEGMKG